MGIGGCENYLRAAQIAEDFLGSDWNTFLDQMFKRQKLEVDASSLTNAKAIWEIGANIIITTNYDKVMEWACPNEEVDTIDNRQVVELSQILTSNFPNSAVWHIHGSIINKADIILGEKSYHSHYGSNRANGEPTHAALQAFRTMLSSYTLLFIGFSMDDDYIRSQLEDVNALFKGANMHYIILHESQREIFKSKNIPIEPVYVSDFESDLLQKLSLLRRKSNSDVITTPTKSLFLTQDIINEWENRLRKKKNKKSTINSMRVDVRKFAERFPNDIAKLTKQDILSWLEECEKQGLQRETVSRRLTSIKNLFAFLMADGLVDKDPTYRIKLASSEQKETRFVPLESLRQAMNAMPLTSPMNIRDAALFKGIYYCGLRSEEVSNLLVEDLDVESKTLNIKRSDGISRTINVHDDAIAALSLWLEKHPTREGALFCSFSVPARSLKNSQIRYIIRDAFERIGLKDQMYNPRALRHSLGFHLAESNVNPLTVSKLLGHKNVYSTSRYFNK